MTSGFFSVVARSKPDPLLAGFISISGGIGATWIFGLAGLMFETIGTDVSNETGISIGAGVRFGMSIGAGANVGWISYGCR